MNSQPKQVRYIASLLREVQFLRETAHLFQFINPEYAAEVSEYADANEASAIWLCELTPDEFCYWHMITVEEIPQDDVDWMFANRIEVAA